MKKVFTSLLLLPGFVVFASDPVSGLEYHFRNITFNHGMHSSVVYKAIQDSDGVMWFALKDGIDKYNGYDFKHYKLYSTEYPGATNTPHVRSIIQDEHEQIWAVSDNGLYRFDDLRDDFQLVRTGLKERYLINLITVIYRDPSGTIYMGTNSGTLVYDTENDSVYTIQGFASNVLSFFPQGENKLWIGTDTGLKLYDTEIKRLVDQSHDQDNNERMQGIAVLSYFQLDDYRLLLGTRRNGLLLFNPKIGKLQNVTPGEMENLAFSVRDIISYNNRILLGTDGAGLVVLDGSLGFVERHAVNEDLPNTLNNNGIYDLFVDNEKRLWISTYGGGVDLFDPNMKTFATIQHQPNNPNSLIANMGRAAIEDSRNKIWF